MYHVMHTVKLLIYYWCEGSTKQPTSNWASGDSKLK
jgi:hypothetical protein